MPELSLTLRDERGRSGCPEGEGGSRGKTMADKEAVRKQLVLARSESLETAKRKKREWCIGGK